MDEQSVVCMCVCVFVRLGGCFMTCMCHAFCISCDSDVILFPCFTSAVPLTHTLWIQHMQTCTDSDTDGHTQTCHTGVVTAEINVTLSQNTASLSCDSWQKIKTTYDHLFFIYVSMYLFFLSFHSHLSCHVLGNGAVYSWTEAVSANDVNGQHVSPILCFFKFLSRNILH